LAFYRCYAPHPVGLPVLVQVAGRRWTVEQSFQTSKGQTGLDEHQVRTWRSWHRWTTLVLVAHLFLAIATATARTVPAPAGLIPLTLNEFRHLFAALVITPALPVRQVGLFRTGDGDTSTAPKSPTTSDKPTESREDHDLLLEYWCKKCK
jgi:hypothetical protein